MNFDPRINQVVEKYSDIRAGYKAATSPGQQPTIPFNTSAKGFFRQMDQRMLGGRYAGIDKLFYTLVNGIVEDPDYAIMKDSKIYERMLRDPQIYYCLMVRKSATSGLDWSISPPNAYEKDTAAIGLASAAERRIRLMPQFNEFLDNMLDALLPGMSVTELCWELQEGKYIVKAHFPVNKDRTVFDREGAIRLRSPRAPVTGLVVPPYKFIVHRFNIADGSWLRPENAGYTYYGKGLADTPLYHYFFFKIQAMRYLMRTLERYGNPFKVFYTGSQNTRLASRAHEILAALENDASVVIPGKKGEMDVDVPKGMVPKDIFSSFIQYVDTLITRAILGQELMTEMPAVGSYAAAQVHQGVFERIVGSDGALLEDTINRSLMKYDAQLNTPNVKEEVRPEFRFKKVPKVDISVFLNAVQAALSMGVTVSEAQFRELTGLREPQEGEGTITPMQMQQPGQEGEAPKPQEQEAQQKPGKEGNNGQGRLRSR